MNNAPHNTVKVTGVAEQAVSGGFGDVHWLVWLLFIVFCILIPGAFIVIYIIGRYFPDSD